MKKDSVKLGQTYVVKVSGKVAPVKLTADPIPVTWRCDRSLGTGRPTGNLNPAYWYGCPPRDSAAMEGSSSLPQLFH